MHRPRRELLALLWRLRRRHPLYGAVLRLRAPHHATSRSIAQTTEARGRFTRVFFFLSVHYIVGIASSLRPRRIWQAAQSGSRRCFLRCSDSTRRLSRSWRWAGTSACTPSRQTAWLGCVARCPPLLAVRALRVRASSIGAPGRPLRPPPRNNITLSLLPPLICALLAPVPLLRYSAPRAPT